MTVLLSNHLNFWKVNFPSAEFVNYLGSKISLSRLLTWDTGSAALYFFILCISCHFPQWRAKAAYIVLLISVLSSQQTCEKGKDESV